MAMVCVADGGAFNLLEIGRLQGKGRIQDMQNLSADPQVGAILAMGKEAIPELIEALESSKPFARPPIDFWPKMSEGDMALVVLSDLLLDPTGRRSTVTELCWDNVLERESVDISASELLDRFVKAHGRAELARRWRDAWSRHGSTLQWDPVGRYFRADGRELVDCSPLVIRR